MIFETVYNDTYMNLSIIVMSILFAFLSFIFFTYVISLFKKDERFEKWDELPKISVLIPAFNEENNILSCLKSIEKSDYNKSLIEVIVINDGSTDKTSELVINHQEKSAMKIILVQGEHKGKSPALNQGVKLASNEIIMSIDADINIKKNTIIDMITPLTDNNVAATNCVALIREPKNMVGYFQMIEFSLNNLIRTSFSKVYDNSIWFFGAVAMYKKKVLKEVGYFKTDTLTEDMDICLEMFNKNYKIITVKDAMITTTACPTLMDLFKQRMRWYFGALQSLFKNRHLLKRGTPSIVFLFFNQLWWTFFSFIFLFILVYQVSYWLPQGNEIYMYLFRWFSLLGPFTVLYKVWIEEWALSYYNVFGVLSGVITLFLSIGALYQFKGKKHLMTAICLFFYFPYTIIQNVIIISGVIKYSISKKKYFV